MLNISGYKFLIYQSHLKNAIYFKTFTKNIQIGPYI